MKIDELQADVPDLVRDLDNIRQALSNAESCDSKQDFMENIREAASSLLVLSASVKTMIKQGEKCSK